MSCHMVRCSWEALCQSGGQFIVHTPPRFSTFMPLLTIVLPSGLFNVVAHSCLPKFHLMCKGLGLLSSRQNTKGVQEVSQIITAKKWFFQVFLLQLHLHGWQSIALDPSGHSWPLPPLNGVILSKLSAPVLCKMRGCLYNPQGSL